MNDVKRNLSILALFAAICFLIAAFDNFNGLSDLSKIRIFLSAQRNGLSPDDPVRLAVNMPDGNTYYWQNLLGTVEKAGKYVAMDLSGSTMTSFNPVASLSTGKKFIVSLTLPNTIVSIPVGTVSSDGGFTATFQHFANLKSVRFPAAATLSDNPFVGCTSLTSFLLTGSGTLSAIEGGRMLIRNGNELVSYPSASGSIAYDNITSIARGAFMDCPGLQTVSFPAVTSVRDAVFIGCTGLETVSLPAVTSIGDAAFSDLTLLRNVNIPTAAYIGKAAFNGCTSLETVNIPAATFIGEDTFRNTGTTSLTVTMGATPPSVDITLFYEVSRTKNVTVRIPSDATGYGIAPASTNTQTLNWGNAFRGRGWNINNLDWRANNGYGPFYRPGTYNSRVNSNIRLTFETYNPEGL